MKIALISNVTMDMLASGLRKSHEIVLPDGFGNWIQPCLDQESNLYRENPEVAFVLLDGGALFPFDASDTACDEILGFTMEALKTLTEKRSDMTVFVGTVDVPQVALMPMNAVRRERKLESAFYEAVEKLVSSHGNVVFFELKKIVEDMGRKAFYDHKMRYLGGMPFSVAALRRLGEEIELCIEAYKGKRRKVLAVDLDNTIWNGVVGEDGPTGIKLAPEKSGMPYTELQCRIKELKEMGILLTVLSKNNPAEVDEVFDKNDAMILRRNDITAFSVNWDPKPVNLTGIAKSLNLGSDSFVFIDDNPVEREAMRALHPEVAVPEFPRDASKLPEFMESVYREYFLTIRTTNEDRKKTLLYQVENARRMLKEKSASLESYLESLHITADIHALKESEIERVAQLTQKTNQFNLTTRRYTAREISDMAKNDDIMILTVHAGDRFGDNGLIAVLIARKDGTAVHVDTLLMSCRVMGRTIEHALMNEFEKLAGERGAERITASYLPTAKNAPVSKFYEQMGYSLVDMHDGAKEYELPIECCAKHLSYVTMEARQ